MPQAASGEVKVGLGMSGGKKATIRGRGGIGDQAPFAERLIKIKNVLASD